VTDGGGLWIANSASGYRGIYDTVDESQWNSLPGWQMVWIVR
jgi:hypothetical protein